MALLYERILTSQFLYPDDAFVQKAKYYIRYRILYLLHLYLLDSSLFLFKYLRVMYMKYVPI